MNLAQFRESKILLVDDNPENLEALLEYLKESGLKISIAQSGEEILELIGCGTVEISATCQKDVMEVAVSDTGIGIQNEKLPTLFRIDAKYQRRGTADEEGTGLGLILCKELIERNDGKIWVESGEGQGTTVRFTLPGEKK